MTNYRINREGKLERGKPQTNRKLNHYNDTINILNEHFNFKLKKKRVAASSANKTLENLPSIKINSVNDTLPASKFTGNTLTIFKGQTFIFMAREYPYVFLKFLSEHNDLFISKSVMEKLLKTAKNEIDKRSVK